MKRKLESITYLCSLYANLRCYGMTHSSKLKLMHYIYNSISSFQSNSYPVEHFKMLVNEFVLY